MKRSKRMKEIDTLIDPKKVYKLSEAVEVLKKCPQVKFDQSLNVALKIGVDPKKSEGFDHLVIERSLSSSN